MKDLIASVITNKNGRKEVIKQMVKMGYSNEKSSFFVLSVLGNLLNSNAIDYSCVNWEEESAIDEVEAINEAVIMQREMQEQEQEEQFCEEQAFYESEHYEQ